MKPIPDQTVIYLEDIEPATWPEILRAFLAELPWCQIEQAAIAALSFSAIALCASTGPLQKWGFVVGLISQPLWIHATWSARQWGMLALSIGYVPVWIGAIAVRFF